MSSSPPVPSWSSSGNAVAAFLLALLAALLAVVAGAGSASAHDALISVTPADGSTVESAPASVDLVFAEAAIALGTEILVLGPDGAKVSTGPAVLADATVSQPLVDARPAGAYTVRWRVTSADGHPISGELTFTASTPVAPVGTPPAPTPTPSASSSPAGDATASGDATGPADAPSSGTTTPPTATGDGGGSALPWVIGGSAVAVALAAGAIWWVRRAQA